METLPRPLWTVRQAAHEARVDRWLRPHLERRRAGVAHPVEDFLFEYYSQRPAALRRWHPGHGTALADAAEHRGLRGYVEVDGALTVSAEHVVSRREVVHRLRTLLVATAAREPRLGCFGLHEWAMVYRQPQQAVRHRDWPLRLGGQGTDAVVESHRVACSHFDAFRFFTEPARALNTLRPGSDDRQDFEQPGCLHAGMDLYKHAFRLSPMVASELVADCFELARAIRVLDMRASPYDLSGLGHAPVRIETAAGKAEYVEAQRDFVERAAPLRARLVAECERLLAAADAVAA
ncbi:MAG: 3-methyladenine DNA glycosylase [Nocardioidaceae bacterium]